MATTIHERAQKCVLINVVYFLKNISQFPSSFVCGRISAIICVRGNLCKTEAAGWERGKKTSNTHRNVGVSLGITKFTVTSPQECFDTEEKFQRNAEASQWRWTWKQNSRHPKDLHARMSYMCCWKEKLWRHLSFVINKLHHVKRWNVMWRRPEI